MTLRELNELRDMRFHIKRLKRRIAEIESAALPQSPKTDNSPGGTHGNPSKTERVVEKTERHKAALYALKEDYERRVSELETEIYSLDDEHIKAILISRFVDARSWVQVAHEVGGGNTADGVRKACFRFFQKI